MQQILEHQAKALEYSLRWADVGLRYLDSGHIDEAAQATDYAQGWFAKALVIEKLHKRY